jgi:hypothetical protein
MFDHLPDSLGSEVIPACVMSVGVRVECSDGLPSLLFDVLTSYVLPLKSAHNSLLAKPPQSVACATDVHIIALLLLFAPPPKFLTPDRRVNILLHYRGNAKVKSGI